MPDGTPLRFVIQDFQPATFLERGAWVPFTSPMLAHARLRIGTDGRREVVIRNPGGGAGWYVGAWNGMIDGARLSVHDRLLYRRIEATNAQVPQAVRQVGRAVALEGYAGRAVQDAARAGLAAASRDLAATVTFLDQSLRRALNLAEEAPLAGQLANALGLSPHAAEARLAALAECIAPVGGPPDGGQNARDLAALGRLVSGLPPAAEEPAARVVHDAAARAKTLAEQALREAISALADPVALLRAWPACAAPVQRLSWLLDGWPALAAAWQAGAEIGPLHARHALAAIMACLPLMPRQLTGAEEPPPPGTSAARALSIGQEWLRGATERDIVARNEALLARAL